MTKTVCTAHSIIALVTTTVVVALLSIANCSNAVGGIAQDQGSVPTAISMSSEIDTTWRHTRLGWQNSADWYTPNSFVRQQSVELVHPAAWAGFILIGVIGTMIWASSEWEISRLFEDKTDVIEESGETIESEIV